MRLLEALEQTTIGALRRVADAHALPHDDSTTRTELIHLIAERLSNSGYLEERFGALSEVERAVLKSARSSGGELRGFLVDSEHPGAAESLADRGWLYRVFAAAGPLRGEVFVIPDELLQALPRAGDDAGSVGAPAAGTFEAEPPAVERRSSDPAFSLFALVSALTRVGGHLEREVRSWSEEPGGWAWDTRWNFLRYLALASGQLIHRADGTLAAAPGLPRLLDEPGAVADRLWRTYLREAGWSEFAQSDVKAVKAVVPDADLVKEDLVDTLALRRAVVDVVHQQPENRWTPIDGLLEWLQRTRPTLVREQLSPRGMVLLQTADWSALELPLVRSFVLGPLYWLGVVAVTRDGQSFARRPLLRAFPGEPCHWQESNAELVAPARAPLGVLLQTERYLVLQERGRVSRYHLVQSHVAASLGAGGSIAECRQLLGRLTQGPLPALVEARLSAWEKRFGALQLRPTVLLQAQSAAELDEAINEERVRPFVRARLGPTVAEIAAATASELAAVLRDAGHLPHVDAALRLAAEPRQAYSGLIDEQVLEFLLVSLLAFRLAWPERLAELEGSVVLLERLEHQFPPQRLADLRVSAERLAGALSSRGGATSAKRAKRRAPSRRRPHRPSA